jgi:hypothetical protein
MQMDLQRFGGTCQVHLPVQVVRFFSRRYHIPHEAIRRTSAWVHLQRG